jgi:hypothetical protein
MKVPVDWNDCPEMLELVANALDKHEVYEESGARVWASEEEGSYGERGVVDVMLPDGRKFRLDLYEMS